MASAGASARTDVARVDAFRLALLVGLAPATPEQPALLAFGRGLGATPALH